MAFMLTLIVVECWFLVYYTTITNQKICLTHYLNALYLKDIIIKHLITLYSQQHLALVSNILSLGLAEKTFYKNL